MSTSSLMTIGAVFLLILILTAARKTISAAVSALIIAVAVVMVMQTITGEEVMNLGELKQFALEWVVWLFNWLRDVFLPKLAEATGEFGKYFELG